MDSELSFPAPRDNLAGNFLFFRVLTKSTTWCTMKNNDHKNLKGCIYI